MTIEVALTQNAQLKKKKIKKKSTVLSRTKVIAIPLLCTSVLALLWAREAFDLSPSSAVSPVYAITQWRQAAKTPLSRKEVTVRDRTSTSFGKNLCIVVSLRIDPYRISATPHGYDTGLFWAERGTLTLISIFLQSVMNLQLILSMHTTLRTTSLPLLFKWHWCVKVPA